MQFDLWKCRQAISRYYAQRQMLSSLLKIHVLVEVAVGPGAAATSPLAIYRDTVSSFEGAVSLDFFFF